MNLSGNTILVTGGASGIGLALASRFLAAGSDVIVCGRREAALRAAAAAHPDLVTRACDLARADERESLAEWVVDEFPDLNVLVNNAGIQRRFRLTDPESWEATHHEIAINLDAPNHLGMLLLPHLRTKPSAAIVNVTSGLAYVPFVAAPVYSATKAALHSYTLSLRHHLAESGVRVIEIVPPAVNTDLGGPGLHTTGEPLEAFADAVTARIGAGELEIGYGSAEQRRLEANAVFDQWFERMNRRPPR
jgi:uncharacterized oxidoreductase